MIKKSAHPVSTDDRRKHSRKTCLMAVNYSIQGRPFTGHILDISVYGAFIETSDYFFSGQEIFVTFSVPHCQKPLTVTGEIVWSSQNGMGIKFSQLTSHQHQMIMAFSETPEEVYKIKSELNLLHFPLTYSRIFLINSDVYYSDGFKSLCISLLANTGVYF